MIANLIVVSIILMILYFTYLLYRNNKVYHFSVGLDNFLFDEQKRILDTYKNDGEFFKDEKNYKYIKEKIYALLDKNSYEKYLFSFKPLRLENWFTKEELKFIKYLKQYRNEVSNM